VGWGHRDDWPSGLTHVAQDHGPWLRRGVAVRRRSRRGRRVEPHGAYEREQDVRNYPSEQIDPQD